MSNAGSEQWNEVKRILWQALELPPEEREEFVDAQCSMDLELQQKVRQLLQNDDQVEELGFLEQPVCSASDLSSVVVIHGDDAIGARAPAELPVPKKIARYEVSCELGRGAFGVVLLAHDPLLARQVAVKLQHRPSKRSRPSLGKPNAGDAAVPRTNSSSSAASGTSAAMTHLRNTEGRVLAKLDHPHIVPVFDVGALEDGRQYVVSKYITGTSLEAELRADKSAYGPLETARMIAAMAYALQHAHSKKIIHRDVKPANILVAEDGTTFLTDFGVSLTGDHGDIVAQGYTPSYASPEQAAGESHHVDGRSDIFSLGVVMYQLLVGERPFIGSTLRELLENILRCAPRPPRQLDASVPSELERICLTALAKRQMDRYTTAHDMAEDLSAYIHGASESMHQVANRHERPASAKQIVPKGLRSFDEHDANFFLDLLPGPRDRAGLPETLAFLMQKIESRDPSATFSNGLIYGPSGSGKSSLIKAGLIPRLSQNILPIYIEVTGELTEQRLIAKLAKHIPSLPQTTDLHAALLELRRSGDGKKVVLFLDQFEKWLHRHPSPDQTELVNALRQADGAHLQVVVLVRDEFWMAITEFMRALDTPLQEGINCRAVDRFHPKHARKVLAKFGQAYGDLHPSEAPNLEQNAFLDAAIEQLTVDDRVICVRLALFAQMMEGKPWSPSALNRVGGAAGVGVEFLEASFSRASSPPSYRIHEAAIRRVLDALLPSDATDIKGHMRSEDQLREIAAYEDDAHFAELLQVLDSQARLITPIDPANLETDNVDTQRHYQLTHDYLVSSVREWLTRKRKESWVGRAELCLEELAARYGRAEHARFLPTPLEYVTIQCATHHARRAPDQKKLLRAAGKRYATLTVILVAIGAATSWFFWNRNGHSKAEGLVQSIYVSDMVELPSLVDSKLPQFWRWAKGPLQHTANDPTAESGQRLRASIAIAANTSSDMDVDYLLESLLRCTPHELPVIAKSLAPFQARIEDRLWQHRDNESASERLRAGLTLARFQPNSKRWTDTDRRFLVTQLVNANPENQGLLRDNLRGMAPQLLPALEQCCLDTESSDTVRQSATNAIADFAGDDGRLIARLACAGSAQQFKQLFPLLTAAWQNDVSAVRDELSGILRQTSTASGESAQVNTGRMRAGAAICLLRLGDVPTAMTALRMGDDPEPITQFVHTFRARGATVEQLVRCIASIERHVDADADVAVAQRYAVLLALGEFEATELSKQQVDDLLEVVRDWYWKDPSATIHGVCRWLLLKWGQHHAVAEMEATPVEYDRTGKRNWFIQRLGKSCVTFVVFPAGEYHIGSAPNQEFRKRDESQYRVRITRSFAVADREVTQAQFSGDDDNPEGDMPAVRVSWHDAVAFCNRLTVESGELPADQQCYTPSDVNDADLSRGVKEEARNWWLNLERTGLRLPTEAEWECFCRAGTATTYSFGSDRRLLPHYAWYFGNVGRMQPVGQLRPNYAGLFDVHGSVWEWCHDLHSYYDHEAIDPTGANFGMGRILRGGAWDSNDLYLRSANRTWVLPNNRLINLGFRLVMTVDESNESKLSRRDFPPR